MTYKEWLGILLPGSGSSSEGSSETSNEPLIVQTIIEGYNNQNEPILRLNKTNKEIYDAFMSNQKVLLYMEQSDDDNIRKDISSLIQVNQLNQAYHFTFFPSASLSGENENGYAYYSVIK